ncbi:tRNA pseudouridine(13) synthase TruD [Modicisalibacter sp. 'Wilcox']|uniref:tRNA pseudouridine(13) synthase TruD n=1 Tax=Modicisalibacter sp. 'Wilcox' TaxID=2679914 RepID=UPI001F092F6E|nr:tRNA pseudouridine(13) synthase TruD [Modicisalibacter sp. 'Wilcox']
MSTRHTIPVPAWPPDWPRAHGDPPVAGEYRLVPEDFVVEEWLGFAPEGEGEHLWLWLEKRDLGTPELARRVARACEVTPRDVGYAGMKDRFAVTRQWLSVHLPGREAPTDLAERLAAAQVTLLEQARHPRKLKRGVHRGNRFRLRLGGSAVVHPAFASRWERIREAGVPNYFGPQRFGPEGRNLQRACGILARGWRKRDDRQGMMLSAARSYLFNELLAERVRRGDWDRALPGEVLMLDGTQSLFVADTPDAELASRVATGDVHPAGPLWGVGESTARETAAALEQCLGEAHAGLCAALAASGVRTARRALRVRPAAAELHHHGETAMLAFTLPRGAFATAVLRELLCHPTL